jgi:hypothetical protein
MSYDDIKARAAWRELEKSVSAAAASAWNRERPKLVAVDLDGTIIDKLPHYTHTGEFGDPIPGVVEKLNQLRADGWKIVIWTVRQESEEMRLHLEQHNIPYDFINRHPWQPPDGGPKIIADVYIDDLAVNFDGKARSFDRVTEFKPWWKVK